MGMEDYRTVTVHEDTYDALELVRDEYGYQSLHEFIKDAVMTRDIDNVLPGTLQEVLEEP